MDFDNLDTHSSSTSLPATTSTTISVTPTSRASATSTTKRQTRRSTRARSSSSNSTLPRARTRTSDPEFLPSESLLQQGAPTPTLDSTALKHPVIRGDSLWSIAVGRLSPISSDQAIDREWRSIYALNRALIGENPSLIFPGQVLELPPLTIT
ncbi:MAG: LysM peptidoglycan-binding domain-containing protein [Actinobacteria bacterium]|nr:LysM peptidoglycan-binding domain-containing protein [Actinomycetota bacterium]